MKKFGKLIVALLCVLLVIGLVACTDKNVTPTQNAGEPTSAPATPTPAPRTKDVYIGTWWTSHYDGADTCVEDDPDFAKNADKDDDTDAQKEEKRKNREAFQKKWDNLKKVEKKYGYTFYWDNLTYTGVKDSINTSILAGAPDCDIYLTESNFSIPAQFNNLCVDLKKVLPADHDLFTTQKVASYLNLGDDRACLFMRQGGMKNNHRLGYNKQLLDSFGLEDPNELWDKGEWTWDKFREMCKTIAAADSDGDGQPDNYGCCFWDSDQLEQFMLSNGAAIASTPTEQLSSSKMYDVLNFIYELHNVDKVCYPVTSDMDANKVRTMYRNGNIAFFWIDVWVETTDGDDYDPANNGADALVPFDVMYCHWPVGPQGNPETDPMLNDVGGELYMIPAGVQDPAAVFGIIYDAWNWYDFDLELRDDPALQNWWVNETGNREETRLANYKRQTEALAKTTVDLWNSMGVEFNLWDLLDGTMDASTWQTTYKQAFQDGLDNIFKK